MTVSYPDLGTRFTKRAELVADHPEAKHGKPALVLTGCRLPVDQMMWIYGGFRLEKATTADRAAMRDWIDVPIAKPR